MPPPKDPSNKRGGRGVMADIIMDEKIILKDVKLVAFGEDYFLSYHSGEGMEIGSEELNDILVQYLRENF